MFRTFSLLLLSRSRFNRGMRLVRREPRHDNLRPARFTTTRTRPLYGVEVVQRRDDADRRAMPREVARVAEGLRRCPDRPLTPPYRCRAQASRLPTSK